MLCFFQLCFFMPRDRDQKGRFIKKNPPKIQPSELTTPVAGKPTLEELEEKQRTRQRLTLIEQQTLLAQEVKRKQTPKATLTLEKQKETRKIVKQIDQRILEPIEQPIFENKQQLESQVAIIVETMTEEGQGSTILTPEQRLQYEKQQREWRRQREEKTKREVDRKREEERKTQYDRKN